MCWISDELKPITSDGTVRIFKICLKIKGKLCGYWFDSFIYELNKEYNTEMDISYHKGIQKYIGYQGFHSYDATQCKVHKFIDREYNKVRLSSLRFGGTYMKSYNIAHYTIADSIDSDEYAFLIEGYLPKGTQYHVNRHGEIISNKIVLTKIIPIDKLTDSKYYLPIQNI